MNDQKVSQSFPPPPSSPSPSCTPSRGFAATGCTPPMPMSANGYRVPMPMSDNWYGVSGVEGVTTLHELIDFLSDFPSTKASAERINGEEAVLRTHSERALIVEVQEAFLRRPGMMVFVRVLPEILSDDGFYCRLQFVRPCDYPTISYNKRG